MGIDVFSTKTQDCCLSCHSLKWNVWPLTSKCSVIRPWGRGLDWSCIAKTCTCQQSGNCRSPASHYSWLLQRGGGRHRQTPVCHWHRFLHSGMGSWHTLKTALWKRARKTTASAVTSWQWHFPSMHCFGKGALSICSFCWSSLRPASLFTWTQHTLSWPPRYSRLPGSSGSSEVSEGQVHAVRRSSKEVRSGCSFWTEPSYPRVYQKRFCTASVQVGLFCLQHFSPRHITNTAGEPGS